MNHWTEFKLIPREEWKYQKFGQTDLSKSQGNHISVKRPIDYKTRENWNVILVGFLNFHLCDSFFDRSLSQTFQNCKYFHGFWKCLKFSNIKLGKPIIDFFRGPGWAPGFWGKIKWEREQQWKERKKPRASGRRSTTHKNNRLIWNIFWHLSAHFRKSFTKL